MTDASPSHFLIAGDATDLPLLDQLLRRLPVDAYGQVFVEIDAHVQICPLPAPAGLTVHWLTRDEPQRGGRAARAVMGWVSEWMPDEASAHDAPYVMWIGCSTSIVMDRLYDRLGDRLEGMHLHHRPHD
ncbi:SIP domain-containing protein [Microbacterium dextranolyticum]|uniref:SIP-like Rossmann fold domain-containing protein n=1 Tax=Microbacterium dextranolyticum TaxID=36806 RepID=A0A9W6M551_9MICO|nr:SIP domain-containing protein [Microbacterium dextranolyticum]MBM7463912.1 NADPH-dependent ferric siderophore reductase [Microbacterium dextranolyticum]GLJ94994.1 hypothetical protein GCM10017591_10560 [Microbacterium dextranolyticum]